MALTGEIRQQNKLRVVQPSPGIDTGHLVRLLCSNRKSITEQEIYQAEQLDRLEAARVYYDEALICEHPFVQKNCCEYCYAHVSGTEIARRRDWLNTQKED